MYKTTITPRFYETDAFGHINNTVFNGWFEAARIPLFSFFKKGDSLKDMNLILARTEVDFVAQTFYEYDVEIHTWIDHIGNSSFVVAQELYQNGDLTAKGKAVQVHFDPQAQRPLALTDELKAKLAAL